MIKYETNSKLVKPGQIFVAIKGARVDAHDLIDEAIKNGASEAIVEREVESSIPITKVKDTKEFLKERLIEEYAEGLSEIKFIGVTGTNGKTTTCYLTYQLLQNLNTNVAYLGTIGFYHGDHFEELNNTTPDILSLYKLLFQAKENGAKYIVMEVSSHALALERIAGLKYDVTGFTNLSQDHMDFHGTMENYLNAKLLLVDYLKTEGTMIVNSDDERSIKFQEKANLSKSVGLNGDYKIINHKTEGESTLIDMGYQAQSYQIKTNLIGEFNVYNFLIALALVHTLEFKIEDIIEATKEVYPPSGRLQTITVGKGHAVVDYAHTPDAVEKIIKECRKTSTGKIITIVGCGGDRDTSKRPIMGKLALENSDYVIFTNDNPRTEDPKLIMEDILRSNEAAENYRVIFDRSEAIIAGLDMIELGDKVLILGKGHENYQTIGHENVHHDDAEIARNYHSRNFK